MAYNLTNVTGAMNPLELFAATNAAANYWIGYLALITLFGITLIVLLRRNPPKESVFAASILTTIVSILFLSANLVGQIWVIGFGLIAAVSAASLWAERR